MEPRRRELEVRVKPLATLFAWAIVFILALYFIEATSLVGLGFLAAACLAAALRPLRDWIPGPNGVGAVVAGFVPLLVVAGAVAAISWFVTARLEDQIGEWPEVEEALDEFMASWARSLGVVEPPTIREGLQLLGQFLLRGGLGWITTTANAVIVGLIALAFLFFGCLFLLIERQRSLIGPALRLLPPPRRPQVEAALATIDFKLRWWTIGTLASMSLVGLASWIGYSIIGLPMALPIALLAAAGEIVPTVGPAFAFLVALLIALTQDTQTVVGVLIVYAVIQILESYVIVPLIMKRMVRIPPVVSLFTVVLWAQFFGVPGLLLALPINLVIWGFAEQLLGGRDPPQPEQETLLALPGAARGGGAPGPTAPAPAGAGGRRAPEGRGAERPGSGETARAPPRGAG